MAESFTAVEYAVLSHLKVQGRGTVPTISADLLLRPSEVEQAASALVFRNVLRREGDYFMPGECCPDVSLPGSKGDTLRFVRPAPKPFPAAAPAAVMPDVASVFRHARDNARKEKAGS